MAVGANKPDDKTGHNDADFYMSAGDKRASIVVESADLDF